MHTVKNAITFCRISHMHFITATVFHRRFSPLLVVLWIVCENQ